MQIREIQTKWRVCYCRVLNCNSERCQICLCLKCLLSCVAQENPTVNSQHSQQLIIGGSISCRNEAAHLNCQHDSHSTLACDPTATLRKCVISAREVTGSKLKCATRRVNYRTHPSDTGMADGRYAGLFNQPLKDKQLWGPGCWWRWSALNRTWYFSTPLMNRVQLKRPWQQRERALWVKLREAGSLPSSDTSFFVCQRARCVRVCVSLCTHKSCWPGAGTLINVYICKARFSLQERCLPSNSQVEPTC